MILDVYGKKNRTIKKDELKKSIYFMMKLMNAHRILKNVYICIQFEKLDGYLGFCSNIDKNSFEITIDSSLKREEVFHVLAHELVHLKQISRRELKFFVDRAIWKGKEYNLRKTHYYDLPWEIEATGRDKGLAERFLISLK